MKRPTILKREALFILGTFLLIFSFLNFGWRIPDIDNSIDLTNDSILDYTSYYDSFTEERNVAQLYHSVASLSTNHRELLKCILLGKPGEFRDLYKKSIDHLDSTLWAEKEYSMRTRFDLVRSFDPTIEAIAEGDSVTGELLLSHIDLIDSRFFEVKASIASEIRRMKYAEQDLQTKKMGLLRLSILFQVIGLFLLNANEFLNRGFERKKRRSHLP